MYSYFLEMIYRQGKSDEVGVKEGNLKSKFLKQVNEDGPRVQVEEWIPP